MKPPFPPDFLRSSPPVPRSHRPAKGLLLLLLWWSVPGLAPVLFLTGPVCATPSGHPPSPPQGPHLIPCVPGSPPRYVVEWTPVEPPAVVRPGTRVTARVLYLPGTCIPAHMSDVPPWTGDWPWTFVQPSSETTYANESDTAVTVRVNGTYSRNPCKPREEGQVEISETITGVFTTNGLPVSGGGPNLPGASYPYDPGGNSTPVLSPNLPPHFPLDFLVALFPYDDQPGDGEVHGEVTLDAPRETYELLNHTNHKERSRIPTLCKTALPFAPPPAEGPAPDFRDINLRLDLFTVKCSETPLMASLIIQPSDPTIAQEDYEIKIVKQGNETTIGSWPYTAPEDAWQNGNNGQEVFHSTPAKTATLKFRPKVKSDKSPTRSLSLTIKYQPKQPDDAEVLPRAIRSTYVNLVPIDIEEVISDQIAGNEANKLPTAYFGGNPAKKENGHPNNPMLMATRSGLEARLVIKMNVPVEHAASIWVGVRQTGQTTIFNSVPSMPPPGKTELPFSAVAGSQLYEVVAGYVANSNASGAALKNSDVAMVFEKTPKKDKEDYPATANLHLLDKIIVVTQDDFNAARTTTNGHSEGKLVSLYPSAAGLLKAFAIGTTVVPGVPEASPTGGHALNGSPIPSAQGLAHAVGGKWTTPANTTTTYRFEFPSHSDLAGDVAGSDGIVNMIGRLLANHKATLAAAATSTESVVTLNSIIDDGINFAEDDRYRQVHVALGACRFEGILDVKVKKGAGSSLEVSEVNCYGAVLDLYDWAYGADKLVLPVFKTVLGEPKEAAKVQAGYATLAASTAWPNAGRIFFTKVNFGTGWKGYDVTIP